MGVRDAARSGPALWVEQLGPTVAAGFSRRVGVLATGATARMSGSGLRTVLDAARGRDVARRSELDWK
jgi:hypothetical protein